MSSTGVIGNRLPMEKLVAGAKRFDLTSKMVKIYLKQL